MSDLQQVCSVNDGGFHRIERCYWEEINLLFNLKVIPISSIFDILSLSVYGTLELSLHYPATSRPSSIDWNVFLSLLKVNPDS